MEKGKKKRDGREDGGKSNSGGQQRKERGERREGGRHWVGLDNPNPIT